MLRNLKWNEVEPGFVAIWHNARSKEISDCFLNNLCMELRDYSPVRDQINKQYFPVYREYYAKRKKDRNIVYEGNTLPVDHYRRMRKQYLSHGIAGVMGYLRNIAQRYRLPKEGTMARENLTKEQVEEYTIVSSYFNGLAECVLKGVLPKRIHHEKSIL